MPGPWPGRVVSLRSPRCLDEAGVVVDADVVREMMDRGMRALTGEPTTLAAWRRFFEPGDVVGIKVNAGGVPHVVSNPAIVAETCRQLMAVGVPPAQIVVFERFQNQLDGIGYPAHLPEGVEVYAAEAGNRRTENRAYDPATYVEVDFFGEEDTRSNMMRLVSQRLTKIVNIPNMKDHGATGATGCLKNVAYGCFSNVARSHSRGQTHTRTAVGTLRRGRAAALALRAPDHGRTARGLARGAVREDDALPVPPPPDPLRDGPGGHRPAAARRHRRQEEGRGRHLDLGPLAEVPEASTTPASRDADPNVNILIREPGHVEYAGRLGLGVADLAKIRVEEIEV